MLAQMPTPNEVTWFTKGESHVVENTFGIILGVIAITVLLYFIYRRWRLYQFYVRLRAAGLSEPEQWLIKRSITALRYRDPLTILENKNNYDLFMNRFSHTLENSSLSEEGILTEANLCLAIRTKLNLLHSYREQRLSSSRSLPTDHPIMITFTDRSTDRRFTFFTKVLYNHDLFLGIAPPDASIAGAAVDAQKLLIDVTFTRSSDAEYFFTSNLAKIVSVPEPMWYLRHSEALIRGQSHVKVDIPARVLLEEKGVHGEIVTHDREAQITHLTNQGCHFRLCDTLQTLDNGKLVLLTIAPEKGEPILCRGKVQEHHKKGDGVHHSVQFSGLGSEELKTLHLIAKQGIAEAKLSGENS